MSTTDVVTNPFKSIMNMLCNNKCWLCEGVFARGKIKKVFMVSHLVRLLKEKYDESSAVSAEPFRFSSPTLQACFEDYCRLLGVEEAVQRRLDEVECASWMSGLICCRTTTCAEEYLLLVPEGRVVVPTPDADAARKREGECPPNCDCDNPWQFISHVLNSNSSSISTVEESKPENEAETKEAGFSFNFAFEQQQKGDVLEAAEISHEKKKKKKKPKKPKNKTITGSETPGEAQSAIATSGVDSSSSDDEPDALLSALKKPSKQVAQPATKGKLQPQPPQPQLDKTKSKKGVKGKGKRAVEVADDEDWFDPQPQNQSRPLTNASSDKSAKDVGGSVFIRSAKDPKLLAGDPLAVQKVKFGDGKNLVAAIGPPKVKNLAWAAKDSTSQLDHTSSPFAFGFAFGESK